jgi:hypothetical protein
MASTTTRFNLDTYAAGDDNWSHTDTVQFVDENAIETDTLANRPANGNYSDELYFATDVRILYRWDSGTTTWNAVAGLGGSSNRISETQYIDVLDSNSIANTDYNESTQTISSASGTTDLDLSQANTFRVEAIDNLTFTFSNVTSTPSGNSITVYVVESDGAGPYTLSWPSSVVWNGGSAVGEVAQNSNVEISLLSDDGGTEWRGRLSGENFA